MPPAISRPSFSPSRKIGVSGLFQRMLVRTASRQRISSGILVGRKMRDVEIARADGCDFAGRHLLGQQGRNDAGNAATRQAPRE